jgi:general secretion pathway protein F
MPVFNYKGLTSGGDAKTGIVDADSPREARLKLRQQNVLVTEIVQRNETVRRDKQKTKLLRFERSKRGRGEVPMYTRQLATLLKAGTW